MVRFVPYEVDLDKEPAIAKKYGVTAIPRVVFIKPDGTAVGDFLGSRDAAAFQAEADKAIAAAS